MSGLCKDCSHWGKPPDPDEWRNGYPMRRYAETDEFMENDLSKNDPHRHRECQLIKLADRRQCFSPPKAFTMDASDYCAVLWAAPDFGCVLFEEKPE